MSGFCRSPFVVPVTIKDAEKINDIAEKSFQIQKECEVSNACIFVSVIVQRCLNVIAVDSKLVYGTFQYKDLQPIAHVWPNINGHVLDNTYQCIISEHDLQEFKVNGVYKEESVSYVENLLEIGDEERNIGIPDHDIDAFEWALKNLEKSLKLFMNKVPFFHYFEKMSKVMSDKYGVQISVVSQFEVNKCWACNKSNERLLKCSRCKCAQYCDRTCQRKDWKTHKIVCLPPDSS